MVQLILALVAISAVWVAAFLELYRYYDRYIRPRSGKQATMKIYHVRMYVDGRCHPDWPQLPVPIDVAHTWCFLLRRAFPSSSILFSIEEATLANTPPSVPWQMRMLQPGMAVVIPGEPEPFVVTSKNVRRDDGHVELETYAAGIGDSHRRFSGGFDTEIDVVTASIFNLGI